MSIGVNTHAVDILSNRACNFNVRMWERRDNKSWPPEQSKRFIPLVLLSYKNQRTLKHTDVMAKLIYTGNIDEVTLVNSDQSIAKADCPGELLREVQSIDNTSTISKDIKEIIDPIENSESSFVFIEGPPGIGKSVLLKEIAYRWGKNQLLQAFKLVMLVLLRDPAVQQIKSLDELLRQFCKGDKNSPEIASACSEYFFNNGGKDLTFLFDGFDEFPAHLQQGSLVMDIINREVLPHCGLVVSSRPHMLEKLHSKPALNVEILGFTENERKLFINQALQEQPKKIEEVTRYLDHHWTISSLCFVPFNIAVLLHLYKQGVSLPRNSTELYNYFVCHTVYQNLIKFGHSIEKPITNLIHLSGPVYKIIKQLSKFSLEALNNNQLVFTLDEIKSACPDIETIPGAIDGFGLLQTIQHLDLTKTLTFNFVHFSVQEFLAADYVTHLTPDEELQLLIDRFWSGFHFNMFTMYIALTKGQQESFKIFLSGGNDAVTICSTILNDQLKCLHLYRCFNEADDHKACSAIENAKIFQHKIIDLRGNRLSASDLECVALFLTSSSNKEWNKLDLRTCYIRDHGLRVLHHWLCTCNSKITIAQLYLSKSGFTLLSSSSFIREMATTCRVKELWIANNENIGEDTQLYSLLTFPSTTLEELNLDYTNLSSRATVYLFNALGKNHTVKKLYIAGNNITDNDDVCVAITTAVKINCTLEKLWMYGNQFSVKTIKLILQTLQVNTALKQIAVSDSYVYTEEIKKEFSSLVQGVNNRRESCNCREKLQEIYFW